jgi:hypothetical protein
MSRTAILLAAIALLGACSGDPTASPVASPVADAPSASQASASYSLASAERRSSVEKDLALLRHVTAPFQDFEVAKSAHWSEKITSCMASHEGGMGFHYGNVALIDGTVSVDKPELLLYEPLKNGHLKLVAVEYIIPYTAISRESTPPTLFGQQFKQNDTFQLWGLHAWVWKENPSGIFADWNPKVNCSQTTDIQASMAH